MRLPIQRLDPAAIIPTRAHSGDAGLDLYALGDALVAPGHELLRVLSDDIWIAEVKLMTPPWNTYVVTKKSLTDAGCKLKRDDR